MPETAALTTDRPAHRVAQIAEYLGAQPAGPDDTLITGVSDFDHAGPGDLTLIGDQRYADRWADCPAKTALIDQKLDCPDQPGKTLIPVENADLAFMKAMTLFTPPPVELNTGVHPTANVHKSASLADDVCIGPNCLIGPGVKLGPGCVLHNNVTILDHTTVGKQCTFWTGVVIRDRCTIGDRCIFHPNAVIGADGFGYRPEMTEQGPTLAKVPQIGTVEIGDDVEIGAGTCIDRAKCNATVIGDGCKIDNLVQIGHNCRLGKMVIVSGCTGIGGSTVIGDGTMIGGHCAITDHAVIGKGVQLAGSSSVACNIPEGATFAGIPARPFRDVMRETKAVRELPGVLKDLRRR